MKRIVIVIAIVSVLITAIAGIAVYYYLNNNVKPSTVILNGTVTIATYVKPPENVFHVDVIPQNITFVSLRTEQNFTAVVGNGTYLITLPNEDTYNVTVDYQVSGMFMNPNATVGLTYNSFETTIANANFLLDKTQNSLSHDFSG